jgi:hypothetical protein
VEDGLTQQDLHGNTIRNTNDWWGDHFRPKEEHHLRLIFQNINRFPTYRSHPKNDSLREFMKGTQADIVGLVEMGLKWHKLPTRDRLWERTRGWFESLKITAAYNRHDSDDLSIQQWGGTSLWSINNAAHRAIDSGSDPYDLGRWSWTRYCGRGNITLRVISAYRPCNSSGPLTVYAQHQNYFDEEDIDGCPRTLFTTHLSAELNKWLQEGDQIILMIDANEDIRDFSRSLQQTGLREVLIH